MIEKAEGGTYGDMKWLMKETGRKEDWIRKKILDKHRKRLDATNGGFVQYGGHYLFVKTKMKKFLEDYFPEIVGY